MGFVACCGSSGDRFCDWLWVVGFNVILCLVIVVAVVGGVRFLWPIVWVCWVFVASCAGGFVGFFVVERKREDVRNKLINKLTMFDLDVKNKRIYVGRVMKWCVKKDKVNF